MKSSQQQSTLEKLSQIVDQIEAKLPQEGLRSLCELKLDDRNYECLSAWVKEKLTRSTVVVAGWKAGAIIFNLITEAARREAVGHRLWPIIAPKFSDDARRYLFSGDHPNSELKALIQEAAKRLRLRHVFEEDEAQSWYFTTHLQFGFSAPSFHHHLPEWLCGQNPPGAVSRLLSGNLRSESFCDLWQALRYYRRDWITEERLRATIDKSPWVLPEWKPELVRLSREKLYLEDVEQGGGESDLPPLPLVNDPCLEWTDADPMFKCAVADWAPLGLISSHYHLMNGESVLATLFRQPDGSYQSDVSHVRFDAQTGQSIVKLVDADGDIHLTQVVNLRELTSEVNVFEQPGGQRLSTAITPMSEHKSYLLMIESDLRLAPAAEQWTRIGGPHPRLVAHLTAPWNSRCVQVATPDGVVLWKPQLREQIRPTAEPSSLRDVRVQLPRARSKMQIGQRVQPVVRGLPSEANLAYVRFSGRPLAFDVATGELEPFVIAPEDAHAGIEFKLGVSISSGADGQTIVPIRRFLDAEVCGTVELNGAGWRALPYDALINSRACREHAFRVYCEGGTETGKVALMEGPRFLRWISHRAAPLGHAYGMGAPLLVQRQPYNSLSRLLTIARGVDDGGIVAEVARDAASDEGIHIKLSQPLAVSDDHVVVVWPGADNEVDFYASSQLIVSEDNRQLSVDLKSPLARGSIAAIGYRGRWLGSGAIGDVEATLHSLDRFTERALPAAAVIRWLRLPVLLRDTLNDLPPFALFARAFPEAALAAWLRDDGLPKELKHDEGIERQQIETTILRDLYLAWTPTDEQARAIVVALATHGVDPLGDVVDALLMELPLVVGHIMRSWLTSHGVPGKFPLPIYMALIRARIDERASDVGSAARIAEELLQRSAQSMKVGPQATADDYFVEHAVADPAIQTLRGEGLTPLEQQNLAIALQVVPFRKYLGLRVLDEIERELQGR